MMKKLAALLLALLGLARGTGGLVLMLRGAKAVDAVSLPPGLSALIGVGLLIVALLAFVAAYGLMRDRSWGPTLAVAAPIVFVLDGLMNGALLFGRPGDRGTLVNLLFAALILGLLWFATRTPGRKS